MRSIIIAMLIAFVLMASAPIKYRVLPVPNGKRPTVGGEPNSHWHTHGNVVQVRVPPKQPASKPAPSYWYPGYTGYPGFQRR